MELPSVEEMMDALSSPVVPKDAVDQSREDDQAEGMNTHTEILLDLVKSVQRLEDKIDARGKESSNANPPVSLDSSLFGTSSLSLEF